MGVQIDRVGAVVCILPGPTIVCTYINFFRLGPHPLNLIKLDEGRV